jgi:hypothetical protein
MVQPWVKALVEDVIGPSKLKVGLVTKHPDGRTVKITDGYYWGAHGISNFWYWREVQADGKLSEKLEHGYGWL